MSSPRTGLGRAAHDEWHQPEQLVAGGMGPWPNMVDPDALITLTHARFATAGHRPRVQEIVAFDWRRARGAAALWFAGPS